MSEKLIRYALRHCRPSLASREKGVWQLAGFRKPMKVVGSQSLPLIKDSNMVKYDSPTMIFFDKYPSVSVREDASKWAGIVKDQTSWTKYVFGEEFLFPKDKPIVLACPRSQDDAYAEHANVLVPSPPLVCLEDREAIEKAARIAGASVLVDSKSSPDEAREAAGLKVAHLAVGDGYVEFIPSQTIPPNLVVIVGPRHADATRLYQTTLDKVVDYATRPLEEIDLNEDNDGGKEVDEEEDIERFAREALSAEDCELLSAHLIYACSHGSLFESSQR